jgi:hypothetical protein
MPWITTTTGMTMTIKNTEKWPQQQQQQQQQQHW